jgi:N-acetylglutamate synthase
MGGEVRAMLAARGYQGDARVPLMVLDTPAHLSEIPASDLTVEQLEPQRAEEHVKVAAAAFEMSEELVRGFMAAGFAENKGLRLYVGLVDGEAVSTALGFTEDDHVGVFNVGTLPNHRRKGYGAVLSSKAVADGFNAGAEWAYLQSSAAGLGVYEQLGFHTVERWWWLYQQSET